MSTLQMVYSELPPSSNRLYFRGTILTKIAREYAERFSMAICREYLPAISQLDPNALYALHLRFFFDNLETDTWLKATKDQRAAGFVNKMATVTVDGVKRKERKNVPLLRYRRVDLDNRVKLVQDCIRDAISIDDSQIFAASQEKHQDPGKERIEIIVQPLADREQFGLSP